MLTEEMKVAQLMRIADALERANKTERFERYTSEFTKLVNPEDEKGIVVSGYDINIYNAVRIVGVKAIIKSDKPEQCAIMVKIDSNETMPFHQEFTTNTIEKQVQVEPMQELNMYCKHSGTILRISYQLIGKCNIPPSICLEVTFQR